MKRSSKAEKIVGRFNDKTKLGDLRKMAKEIGKDHALAMELWTFGKFLPRQLAILIMDSNLLSQDVINKLDADMQNHPLNERNQLMDWLMANQLTRGKKMVKLIEQYLQHWIKENGIQTGFDRIWDIREQCIKKLGE
ncbi:MAG TPA: hypothetical protein VD905_08120 [Flavobacteriales bacterium]|nr:hypothetical protein [Flavobacteriales bacterium]